MVLAKVRRRSDPAPGGGDGDDGGVWGRKVPRVPHSMAASSTPGGMTLHYLTRAMLTDPRRVVHSRVVVVGSSATTAAFLEHFLLVPHLFFSNLTVLSPSGLPAPKDDPARPEAERITAVDEDRPSSLELACMGLASRARVLKGSVCHIDRAARCLTLSPGGGLLPYDKLVLTDGLVDSTPGALAGAEGGEDWDALAAEGIALGLDDELTGPCLSLTEPNAGEALDAALATIGPDADIVVYGATIHAAACVGGLLARGVLPSRVTFVRPGWDVSPRVDESESGAEPMAETAPARATEDEGEEKGEKEGEVAAFPLLRDRSTGPLGDDRAEMILNAALAGAGVCDRSDLTLVGVRGRLPSQASTVRFAADQGGEAKETDEAKEDEIKEVDNASSRSMAMGAAAEATTVGSFLDDEGDGSGFGEVCPLQAAVFQVACSGDEEPDLVTLPCALLLSCHGLDARPSLFRALNRAGLAYDGKLVVDARDMTTSDKNIFAGGDLTKFSRLFDECAHHHAHHHPGEVGEFLAASVLASVDPTFSPPEAVARSSDATAASSVAPSGGASARGLASIADDSSSLGSVGDETSPKSTRTLAAPGVGGEIFGRLPLFRRPRTVSCLLPGGLCYARSATAAAADPKLVVMPAPAGAKAGAGPVFSPNSEAVAAVLATGSFKGEPTDKSAALKLDSHGRIVEFSYIGAEAVEPRNIGSIVGLHEAFARSCQLAYHSHAVDDWVAYFRQDWCAALFSDRFPALLDALRARLRGDEASRDVLELMRRAHDDHKDDAALAGLLVNAVGGSGERVTPGTTKRIEGILFEWLTANKPALPGYKLPERAGK